MRFTIIKDELLKALRTANRAIGSRSVSPTLLNFKIEMTPKALEITSSNDDISIFTFVPLSENGKEIIRNSALGSTLLGARTLTEAIGKMEGAEVSFEVVDGRVAKIDDGSVTYKLLCQDADEYPDIDLEKNGSSVKVSGSALIDIADQTAFAALDKDTRPILTAINLKAQAGTLTATATDSARLSRKTVAIDGQSDFSANIPAKTFAEITKLFVGTDEVEINLSAEKAIFQSGHTTVSSRLISGEYPVSNSIIPQNFNYFLEVNSQQLINSIDRVSILSTDKAAVVLLSMSEDGVEISSSSDQTGSGLERLTLTQYTGERLDIAFNASFVSQAVRALGSEDVVLSFIGEMKPFIIRNPNDGSVVELITPMRTR